MSKILMENYLFIESRNVVEKMQNKQIINSANNPNFKWIAILLLFLSFIGFLYIFLNENNPNSEVQTPIIQNSQRLEILLQKATNDEVLTETEWSELCQLLSSEKSLNINDCENCKDYLYAILGGKHEVFVKQYKQKTDKELQKGIRSYQKQIDEHYDKIAHPEKYLPNWKELDFRQRKHLQEIKWNDDIKRQKEQKQILECILKNR